jgi:hypothetical protein
VNGEAVSMVNGQAVPMVNDDGDDGTTQPGAFAYYPHGESTSQDDVSFTSDPSEYLATAHVIDPPSPPITAQVEIGTPPQIAIPVLQKKNQVIKGL